MFFAFDAGVFGFANDFSECDSLIDSFSFPLVCEVNPRLHAFSTLTTGTVTFFSLVLDLQQYFVSVFSSRFISSAEELSLMNPISHDFVFPASRGATNCENFELCFRISLGVCDLRFSACLCKSPTIFLSCP